MRLKYQAEFIGNIKIKDLEPNGYTVELYLDNPYYPLSISADLPDDKFLNYVKLELLSKRLDRTKYFKIVKGVDFCK